MLLKQLMKTREKVWFRLLALLLCLPSTAYAHAPIAGVGDFYNGILHPILSPLHLVNLVALGVLLGQYPPLRLGSAAAVFAPVSAAALVATIFFPGLLIPQPALVALALAVALPVVIGKEPPRPVVLTLTALAATILSLDSAPDYGDPAAQRTILAGTWAAMLIVVCDIAFYCSYCKRPWQRIGLQVLGSWIIAISILLLAFCLKRGC